METSSARKTLNTSTKVFIGTAIEYCKLNNYSIAVWRNPNENFCQMIIDRSADPVLNSELTLEELQTGFLFAPFKAENNKYYLKAEILVKLSEQNIEIFNEESDGPKDFLQYLQSHKSDKRTGSLVIEPSSEFESNSFQDLVSSCVENIKRGNYQKIVPSRFKSIKVDQFDAALNFENLCKVYPNAFISLFYNETTNLWLGASPELLISTSQNNIFKTVSLAGTQKYINGTSPTDVAWTQKEIEEQALVSRFIINCFKKIRLREFDEIGPKTIVAGNLMHLKTEYTVDMEATNFPQLGSVMLDLLHPTSAICGMPMESAYEYLLKNEGYDREFFAGYLGPVNIASNTSLFVNLRCMQIKQDEARLYAGAGVTEDSNPQKEWTETEMKMNTLLNIIS